MDVYHADFYVIFRKIITVRIRIILPEFEFNMKISYKILSIQSAMAAFIIITMASFQYIGNKLDGGFEGLEYETAPVFHVLEKIHSTGIDIFASTNRAMLYKYIFDHPSMRINSSTPKNGKSHDLNHELQEINKKTNSLYSLFQEHRRLAEKYFPDEIDGLEHIRQLSGNMITYGKKLLSIEINPNNLLTIKQIETKHNDSKHLFDSAVRIALYKESKEAKEHHEHLELSIDFIEFF